MPDETSLQVRHALGGETTWDAVIERLSPLLRLQAERRLSQRARRHIDPEDLVDEAWMAVIPRAGELQPRDGRWTPVLLRFLGTTIAFRIQALERKLGGRDTSIGASEPCEPAEPVGRSEIGVVTRIDRRETEKLLWKALRELGEADQEILVLRGVEQRTNGEVALRLGLSPSAVTMRYKRARERILERVPCSVLEELEP